MIEFAFAFGLFVFLMFGFLGLAIVFFSWLSTASAAREGARYLIGDPTAPDSEVIAYVCSTSVALGGSAEACANQVTAGLVQFIIEPSPSSRVPGAQVSVTVRFRVPVPTLAVSFFNGGQFTFLGPIWVQSASVMRLE